MKRKVIENGRIVEVELTPVEVAAREAAHEAHEAKKPRKEALAKITELETIPRAIREMGVRLGDKIAIAEEEAIKLQRNNLKGE